MKSKGFSLVELIVTIVVVGIIMAAAVPAFNSFWESWEYAKETVKDQNENVFFPIIFFEDIQEEIDPNSNDITVVSSNELQVGSVTYKKTNGQLVKEKNGNQIPLTFKEDWRGDKEWNVTFDYDNSLNLVTITLTRDDQSFQTSLREKR